MKKIAFSVWPVLPNNPIPESLKTIRDATSVKVLESAGFEVVTRSELDTEDPILKLMLPCNNGTIRYYTKVADYIRLKFIKEYLDAGYDEVMYFDYDFVIREAPTKFGVCMEAHLETTDLEGLGQVDKFWFRAVNSVYYLSNSQDHKDKFNEHFKYVTADIVSANGNPKFAWPMNSMWMLEEGIGHIPGYWHVGSLKQPQFCTIENIKQILAIYSVMYSKVEKITGYNAMGTRSLESLNEEVDQVFSINNWIPEMDTSDEAMKSIVSRFTPNCRVRPNYNSQDSRAKIRSFIEKYRK